MSEPNLETWVWVWIIVATYVVARQWRSGSVGLLFTYVLSFGALHWLTALLSLLPWYESRFPDLTADGLIQSTFAMMAFAVGAECMAFCLRFSTIAHATGERSPHKMVPDVFLNGYVISGMVMYAVLTRFGSTLPTVNALVNTGSLLTVVGVGLKCWNAWHQGKSLRMWRWFASTSVFPLVTVIAQGFLGYGFAAALTVFAFFASFYRPRWRVMAIAVLLSYFGLSGYVTYMRDRRDIRAVVWSGGDISERLARLTDTLAATEWFDVYNVEHLSRIESRLNQDYLTGAAVSQVRSGVATLANGETLKDAMLGFVPRALWPDKPVTAGSGDLVTTYTGFRFDANTAVGIGQVLECYVNFGTTGVVVGFFLIGALIVLVDRSAYARLNDGDFSGFTLWYLPGLALLNVGGSFVEVTSSAGAAFAVAFIAQRLALHMAPALRPTPWTHATAKASEI